MDAREIATKIVFRRSLCSEQEFEQKLPLRGDWLAWIEDIEGGIKEMVEHDGGSQSPRLGAAIEELADKVRMIEREHDDFQRRLIQGELLLAQIKHVLAVPLMTEQKLQDAQAKLSDSREALQEALKALGGDPC